MLESAWINNLKCVVIENSLKSSSCRLFVRAEAMADDAEEDGAGRGKGKSKRHGGLRTMVPIISRDGPTKRFEHGDKDRYIWWRVTEDTFWPRVKLGLAVLAVLAMCLYQLWPPIMRTGVWYLSVTFLLLLLATIAVQLIVFAVAWLAGWEVWVLPNLWADVPVHKIFSPPIEYKKAGSGAMWTRIALAVCIAGLGYWVYSTPTELQAFLDTQRQMVDDLYSGKLLADGSAAGGAGGGGGGRGPQSNMFGGKWGPGSNRYGGRPAHIPNFEDIEKMVDDFETSTGTASTETPIPTPPPEEGAHAEGEQHAAPDLEAMFEADAQQEAAEAAADAAADAAAGDTASVKSDDSAADL